MAIVYRHIRLDKNEHFKKLGFISKEEAINKGFI